MRVKKKYLDILRVIAIFMVFHFHFILVLEKQGPLWGFANGDWGCVGTSLFFLISGNCLARNYGQELDVKSFYVKRWFSIFPAFYLCYIMVLFGHTVLLQNHVLAGVEPWRLVFTLLGVDNYLNFLGIRNGALVGEWYTAIILLIYLLFPLLQLMYRKSKLWGSVLVLGLYVLNLCFAWGPVPDDAHPLTGIAVFWVGMLLYHFEERLEKMPRECYAGILVIALVLCFVPVPGKQLVYKNAMALCIFLLFMGLERFLADKRMPKLLTFVSKIEYGMYLCHHTVLYVMLSIYTHILGEVKPALYYMLCVIATLVFAAVIDFCTGWLVGKLKGRRNTKTEKACKRSV